jgi:hypothetical protein
MRSSFMDAIGGVCIYVYVLYAMRRVFCNTWQIGCSTLKLVRNLTQVSNLTKRPERTVLLLFVLQSIFKEPSNLEIAIS